MRTQLAVYREEICRLHHANDTLAESNRILLDAVTTMKMEHAAEMQRLRGEMAPGFSWPDPDQSALVERYKTRVEELEAEVRALRLRYEHQNLSGKTEYTRKRSRVSEDMAREAGDAAEEGAGSSKKTGPPAGHKGCSHSNKPVRKVWYVFTRCANCGGRHTKRGRCRCRLVNDFDGSHINIRTVAHIGWEYACADCGHATGPDFPAIPGTSFGKRALGYIVYFGGKKNTDADIASYFGDLFHFETAETTIWNARRAAAGMLEQTMRYIMEELKRATFLGIDETRYSMNGEIGYVWVVRTDRATFVLPIGSRGGLVLSTYFSELADKPVVVDGYAVYPSFFKTIQRCWAHILRDAEEAYVSAGKNSPKREHYHTLYRRLLKVFHDAKRIAGDTAGSGGADVGTCLDLERRVLEIATAYADHDFRTTLTNAAPNLFTFLRYPGMPPTNNGAERDIRDAVVLQRKFRHKFVSPEGMHVFSAIQSFNSTCRKLGLVPWMCVEKIAENPNYNIFEAGPEMARAPAPPADAPESDTLYVDQALVAHPAVGESAAETERPPVETPAAPPDQSPATPHTPAGDRADTEADPHGLVPPLAAGLRPDTRAAMARVPPLPRAITDPDHVPFHGKPPPAVSA